MKAESAGWRGRCWILGGAALGLALGSCTQDRISSGGNSSETPNTLSGRIVDTTGAVRVGDTVEIRPADWISDDRGPDGIDPKWLTLTDSSGRYRFEGIESGSYVVEARGWYGGFVSAVVSVGPQAPQRWLGSDTINAFQDVPGRIVGDSSLFEDSSKIHFSGTDHFAWVDRRGSFLLRGMPTGRIRLLAILGRTNQAARAKDEFRLSHDGLIGPRLLSASRWEDEDYSKWPHRRMARIRFSSKGWYLDSDVPLVPIRVHLDASVLSGSWEATGSSIRFSDSSGTKLPFQIESWDPVARRAEVWVRLALANKGSDGHFLVLHWGREDAPGRSDGTRVFDTAQGWIGVWHLSGPDRWKDATANRLRLVATGIAPAKGVVSDGVVAHPSSRLELQAGILQGWQDATVSMWVKIDSSGAAGNLARLGDLTDPDTSDWRLGVESLADSLRISFATIGQARSTSTVPVLFLPKGVWTSVAGAFSRVNPRIRLVQDNVALGSTWADSFSIHRNPNALVVGGGFTGNLDEVRLHKGSIHPDALRMRWGTDRDASPVLEWQP